MNTLQEGLSLIWMSDALDRLEHAVPDHELVAAGTAGHSRVRAACSAVVRLCSLATPPSGRCPDCETVVDRCRRSTDSSRRRNRLR